MATWYGHPDVGLLLVEKGAKLDIFTAAGLGAKDEVARFLKKDPKLVHARRWDGRTALHWAAHTGQKAVAELLIAHKADVRSNRKGEGFSHRSPLHDAAGRRRKDLVELLLAHKANVNARDDRGYTPLHRAVGDVAIAELLLAHKADVNAIADGRYFGIGAFFPEGPLLIAPLHLAAEFGQANMVGLLLRYKADINLGNGQGNAPLHLAVTNRHPKVIAVLLAAKADVNRKNRAGWAPLHEAAQMGDLDLVKFLLHRKADPNARDQEGWSPLHAAAIGREDWPQARPRRRKDYTGVAALLLAYKADINARAVASTEDNRRPRPLVRPVSDSMTPLHFAVRWGDKALVELLIAAKANVNARDIDGNTPLDSAHDKAIADLLRKHGGRKSVTLPWRAMIQTASPPWLAILLRVVELLDKYG
jgi:cytohesin